MASVRAKQFVVAIAAVILVTLLTGATMAQDGGSLADRELEQLFAGKQVVAASRDDPELHNSINSFLIEFNIDGSLFAVHRLDYFVTSQWGTGGATDTGSWSVQGGRLCLRFANWESAQKTCYVVLKTGAGYAASGAEGILAGPLTFPSGRIDWK